MFLVFAFLAVVHVAAPAGPQATALQWAGLVAAILPILFQYAKQYVTLGPTATRIVVIALSALIALAAGVVSGQLQGVNWGSFQSWATTAALYWGITQLVYAALIKVVPAAIKLLFAPPTPPQQAAGR